MTQKNLSLIDSSNAVLVDPLGLDRALARLASDFQNHAFEDLCGFIVQSVFRDRIVILVTSVIQFPKDTTLAPLLRDGVVREFRLRRQAPASNARFSSRLSAPGQAAERLISAARQTDYPVFTTAFERLEYERCALPTYEHSLCDAIAQYERLAHHARMVDQRSRLGRPSYFNFRIPPLPLEVLKRCKHLDDLPAAILEVRDNHIGLRRHFAELSAHLSDPHLPYGKRIREVNGLQKALSQLHSSLDDGTTARFATSGGYVINGVAGLMEAAAGYAIGDTSAMLSGGTSLVGNAAGAILENGALKRNRWRLEPLSESLSTYLKASDAEMARHMRRLFGYRPELLVIGPANSVSVRRTG